MARLLILVVLLGGMRLILPWGEQGHGSRALLALGFLILAAHTVGEIAAAIRIPRIVGYLAAGVLFGPHGLGALSDAGVTRLAPISQIAIAFIAFLAGAELRWGDVKERMGLLLKITGTELVLTFAALFASLLAVRPWISALQGMPTLEVVAFALLFAAVAVVHSPAVTMALLTETRARGPVARTTLEVVLVSDVIVVLVFSATLAIARNLAPAGGSVTGVSLGTVIWEITGALIVGSVLGGAIALYLHRARKDLVIFAVLVGLVGIEVARIAHVELLLTLLVAGFVMANTSSASEGGRLLRAMERSAAPIFVVFFGLAGARIDVRAVAALTPLIVPLALVRAGAIWAGVQLGSRWAGAAPVERRYVWMGLISQAGVAIGLASIVADAYPARGPQLSALLLALIAINETVGPILFRRALVRSKEIEDPLPEVEPGQVVPASSARE